MLARKRGPVVTVCPIFPQERWQYFGRLDISYLVESDFRLDSSACSAAATWLAVCWAHVSGNVDSPLTRDRDRARRTAILTAVLHRRGHALGDVRYQDGQVKQHVQVNETRYRCACEAGVVACLLTLMVRKARPLDTS